MELTLKELNASFPALKKVAESLTAGKMKYRFAKVLKAAKNELDHLGEHLTELAKKHDAQQLGAGRFKFDEEKQKDEAIKFDIEADSFMKSEKIKLDFDPKYFTFDELTKAEDPKNPINAAVLSDLLWLVSDDETAAETPKAQTAAA